MKRNMVFPVKWSHVVSNPDSPPLKSRWNAICQGYEMQLTLRLVYDINEDLQKLLVRGETMSLISTGWGFPNSNQWEMIRTYKDYTKPAPPNFHIFPKRSLLGEKLNQSGRVWCTPGSSWFMSGSSQVQQGLLGVCCTLFLPPGPVGVWIFASHLDAISGSQKKDPKLVLKCLVWGLKMFKVWILAPFPPKIEVSPRI